MSKLLKSCYMMSKLRYYLDTSALKMVYYSLLYRKFSIVYLLGDGTASCHLRPIVCMHKRIVRYVFCEPVLAPTYSLFVKFKFIYIDSFSLFCKKINPVRKE